MDAALLLANLANPPVLFFFLGMLAVWLRSDLEIRQPVPKVLAGFNRRRSLGADTAIA